MPVLLTSPLAVTTPVDRSIMAFLLVFRMRTSLLATDHSASENPVPFARVTLTPAIRCVNDRRTILSVGAAFSALPHRKSDAS